MRIALVIAARILRQRLRDRSAIIFAVLTPLGLALAFSILIPNEFSAFHTRFVVVDNDRDHVAAILVDDVLGSLAEAGVADVDALSSESEAISEVESDQASAAIIIPAGLTAAVESGQPAEIRIVGGEFPLSLEIARSAVERFAQAVGGVQLMVATAVAGGSMPDAATISAAQAAAGEPGPIAVSTAALDRRQADLATFYGAAMAIMFVFFATQYGALSLVADREVGTMSRYLAAPIPGWSILAGASIAGFVLGLVAMGVLAIATTVLQGADWGPPALLVPLILAAVVAAMGISTLVSSIARTPQQAGGLNAIVALSLAALGGVFIPVSQAPEGLAVAAQVTPHYWFLRGVDTLASDAATLADLGPSIGILLAIGALTGAIGLVRARAALTVR
ncbi:MAG: ABC transporter permease [Chloroflexota bacterium]|nr:MAG: ABC transporter permease [Chloroflexota bacterium]